MQKILYLDTETTGLDNKKNDIVQVAGIIEIEGKDVERFNIFCQPYSWENISEEALAKQNRTIKDLKSYQKPQDAYEQLKAVLNKYVDKYDKTDKFFPAGQNVLFDTDFMREWALKGGDKYFGSYISRNSIDLKVFAAAAQAWGICKFDNLQLESICKSINVELANAHDAMADIEATYKCLQHFKDLLFHGFAEE